MITHPVKSLFQRQAWSCHQTLMKKCHLMTAETRTLQRRTILTDCGVYVESLTITGWKRALFAGKMQTNRSSHIAFIRTQSDTFIRTQPHCLNLNPAMLHLSQASHITFIRTQLHCLHQNSDNPATLPL